MHPSILEGLDLQEVPSPCYVVNLNLLERNLKILKDVQASTGCQVILALKGFAMWSTFPLVGEYLAGVTASSVDEARLGHEELGKAVHICSPAYSDKDFDEILEYVDHITFNSFSQLKRYKGLVQNQKPDVKIGLRVNPRHSEVKTAIYDPCAPNSRLGIQKEAFAGESLEGVSGIHFHTLCELNSDSLERTLAAVEEQFGEILYDMEWVNFGGGHHITREDYDVELLCRLINDFKAKYDVDVILEPGEAIALNTGALVATVLDTIQPQKNIALLDTSAAAHMPDVIEMPYRPNIVGAGRPDEKAHTYTLGGSTCLAGDIIGDYSFSEPLKVGDKLEFLDMAHYSMVKNNTFNGVRLPSIATWDGFKKEFSVVKSFSYEDYKGRLS